MKTFSRTFFVFSALIFSIFSTNCSSHYTNAKVVSPASSFPSTLAKGIQDKKYMMLHSGINLYTITSVQIDNAKENFTVHLDKVDPAQMAYFKNTESNLNNSNNSPSTAPSQIHVYSVDSTSYTLDEPHTIPFSKINRIELLGKH